MQPEFLSKGLKNLKTREPIKKKRKLHELSLFRNHVTKKSENSRSFRSSPKLVRVFAGREGRREVFVSKLSESSSYDFRHVWCKYEVRMNLPSPSDRGTVLSSQPFWWGLTFCETTPLPPSLRCKKSEPTVGNHMF